MNEARTERISVTFVSRWSWKDALRFEVLLCSVSFLCFFVGSVAPQIVLTIPKNGLSIGSNTVVLLAGSFLPAVFLLVLYQDVRAAVLRLSASVRVYVLAFIIGILLPFSGYIGSGHSYPIWDSDSGLRLLRVFLLNLLLSPLWEEVIWRAYFYPQLRSILRLRTSVLLAATGWTIWHIGFVFYLYRAGIKGEILAILSLQFFFAGVIACCLFSLGRDCLAPCVLFHAAFNASTALYYGRYGRVSDTGSYAAQTVVMLAIAVVLLRILYRKMGQSSQVIARIHG